MDLLDRRTAEGKRYDEILDKHRAKVDAFDFRDLILEVLIEFGAEGIRQLKMMMEKIGVTKQFNRQILKIVADLTGLCEK